MVIAWCVMLVTHELGHLFGGWVTGATLIRCDLAPWRLPYSIHQPDPHPLITVWMGPIVGALVPPIVAGLTRNFWAWLVADFCILANGSYLAVAWFLDDRLLDTARLIDAGASPITIALFCLVTISFGYRRFRFDCMQLFAPPSKENEVDVS